MKQKTKRPKLAKPKRRLQFREFVAMYGKALEEGEVLDRSAEGHLFGGASAQHILASLLSGVVPSSPRPSPRPMPWDAVGESWLGDLLRKAAQANHAEAIQMLLRMFLREVGVKPPEGVFVPFPKPLGRRKKESTDQIAELFKRIKPPSLTSQHLARAYYGPEFLDTSSAEKERRVDVCRRAVQRSLPPDEIARVIKSGKKSGL